MAEAEARLPEDIEGREDQAGVVASTLEQIIERFGGIRPMAGKLDIPVTTVQGWKKRGAIPPARHAEILAAAAAHDISLEAADLAAAESPETATEPSSPAPAPIAVSHRLEIWVAAGAAFFIFVVVLLCLAGFYIITQRTHGLEKRVAVLEQQIPDSKVLETRLSLLEQNLKTGGGVETMSPARLAELETQLTDLRMQTAQVAALSQKVQDLQVATGNHDVLAQTVSGVQGTVAALQGTLQTMSQSLDATREKVAQLDTAVSERRAENARQFAILLSIDQLHAAASTSQPFDTELNAARALSRNDPELTRQLDALTPYATDGAPTLNELRAEFADLASEIVRSNVVGSGKSWIRQALYRLSSVISVRKIGSKSLDNTTELFVSRAEGKLEEDDLEGAVASLDGLSGLPKDIAASWVDSATRRLKVDAAMSELTQIAIERVGSLQAAAAPKP